MIPIPIEWFIIATITIIFFVGFFKILELMIDMIFKISYRRKEQKILDLFEVNKLKYNNIKLFKTHDTYTIKVNDVEDEFNTKDVILAKVFYNNKCDEYLRSTSTSEEL